MRAFASRSVGFISIGMNHCRGGSLSDGSRSARISGRARDLQGSIARTETFSLKLHQPEKQLELRVIRDGARSVLAIRNDR